jgi:hypothetical protein
MECQNDLLTRVKNLETRLRRAQLLLVALLVGGATLAVFIRIQRPGPLRATSFILVDDLGKTMARLRHEQSQTCLEIGGGKPSSAYLCADDQDGSHLFLSNHEGADRVFLSAGTRLYEPGGWMAPGLIISQENGANLITGSLGQETKFVVGHATENNSVILSTSTGGPSVRVSGPSGQALWASPIGSPVQKTPK